MLIGLLSLAFAGELVIDAKVPVDVRQQGQPVVRLMVPGRVSMPWDPGPVSLSFDTGTEVHEVKLTVPAEGEQLVLVGRSGLTSSAIAPRVPRVDEPASVQFRVAHARDVLLVLDGERHVVTPAAPWSTSLAPGMHPLSLLTSDGTYQWATGALQVRGGGELVLQLSEGRMPELSGDAGSWLPSQR